MTLYGLLHSICHQRLELVHESSRYVRINSSFFIEYRVILSYVRNTIATQICVDQVSSIGKICINRHMHETTYHHIGKNSSSNNATLNNHPCTQPTILIHRCAKNNPAIYDLYAYGDNSI